MVLGWKRPGRVWICQAIVASLAQSVEHAAVNRSVNGSSPLGSAILEIQHTLLVCFFILLIRQKNNDNLVVVKNYFLLYLFLPETVPTLITNFVKSALFLN